jgi:hypothetical protein
LAFTVCGIARLKKSEERIKKKENDTIQYSRGHFLHHHKFLLDSVS